MFGSEVQKRFAKLERKALQQLERQTKGNHLANAINAGVSAAIGTILEGLKKELSSIVQSREGSPNTDALIGEAFDLARSATSKLMLAGDIKSGKAGWLTYAMKGIEKPDVETIQAAKSSDDVMPIWLRERE